MTYIKNYTTLLLATLALLFAACTKEELVTIPNNQAPPDSTINNVIKENYVNKLYISILGREPSQAEFDEALVIIDNAGLSTTSREQVVNLIAAKPGYHRRIYNIALADYLNSADSLTFIDKIFTYELILQNQSFAYLWPIANFELERLDSVTNCIAGLENGTLSVASMHRRVCNNIVYDDINMGSLNFVASLFQNFLFRYPTESEMNEGIRCVDGFQATVFFQLADSKKEYLDIFFKSTDYYEGQVRDLFKRYLFREPTSAEATYFANRYKSSGSYLQLQRDILTLNEYVGIN